MIKNNCIVALSCLLLAACSSVEIKGRSGIEVEATAQHYQQEKKTKGVVLFEVNWSRVWGCGSFGNAHPMTVGFDRMPVQPAPNGSPSDVMIHYQQGFDTRSWENYALLLEPGEYALSDVEIYVAQSPSQIGSLSYGRDVLLKQGKPAGGTFKVSAGETVYIGNFALDCFQNPMIWRYYIAKADFQPKQAGYARKYPFLDLDNVTYRLFDTNTFGRPYNGK